MGSIGDWMQMKKGAETQKQVKNDQTEMEKEENNEIKKNSV